MRPLLILFVLVFIAGCDLLGSAEGDLALRTDQSAYTTDAEVHLTLRNESHRAYATGSLACAALERRVGDTWRASGAEIRYCTAELIGLGPGEEVEAVVPLDAALEAGTYRFIQAVGDADEYPDHFDLVVSNVFEVR